MSEHRDNGNDTGEGPEGDGARDAAAEPLEGELEPGTPKPKRKSRRVTTPPPEGSDPSPAPEPPRSTGTENDDRLRADKPPHWG